MIKLKQKQKISEMKTTGYFTENTRKKEYGLMGVHALIFILLFPICFHFINIDLFYKNKIKSICLDRIALTDTLQSQYKGRIAAMQDSIDTRAHYLITQYNNTRSNSYVSSKYLDSLNNTIGSGTYTIGNPLQVKKAIGVAQDAVQQKFVLTEMDGKLSKFEKDARPVFNNWQILKVGYNYEAAGNIFNEYKATAMSKMPGFSTGLAMASGFNLQSPFSSLSNASIVNILLSFVLLAVIYFCILLPYRFAERAYGWLEGSPLPRQSNEPEIL